MAEPSESHEEKKEAEKETQACGIRDKRSERGSHKQILLSKPEVD